MDQKGFAVLLVTLTLTRVGLAAAAVGRPPRTVVVKWRALVTVVACCVVSALTPAKHLEDTSGHPQSLHVHAQQQAPRRPLSVNLTCILAGVLQRLKKTLVNGDTFHRRACCHIRRRHPGTQIQGCGEVLSL